MWRRHRIANLRGTAVLVAPGAPPPDRPSANSPQFGSSHKTPDAPSDSTAPTGTVDYVDGLTTADVVSVTTSHSDTQSGVVTRVLQRAVAPMTDTTCGTFGTFTTR